MDEMIRIEDEEIGDEILFSLNVEENCSDEDLENETETQLIENQSTSNDATSSDLTAKSEVKQKRRHGQAKRLNPVLQGLMGEANIRFARGDIKMAQKICLEIIRQEAYASDPYKLLATIFGQNDNGAKQLQMLIIAAHLNPSNVDLWHEIASLQQSLRMSSTAILKTYTKAVSASPFDLQMHLTRIQFIKTHMNELSDNRDMIYFNAHIKLINIICSNHNLINKSNDAKIILMETIDKVMFLCRQNMSLMEKCIKTFLNVFELFKQYPILIKYAIIEFLLNILLKSKNFNEFFNVISYKTIFQVDFVFRIEPCLQIDSFVADSLTPDLKTKILIFLTNLLKTSTQDGVNFLFDQLEMFVLNENIDENADLFADLCDTLMENECYGIALKFFEKLLTNLNFDLPAVWLRYANCLRKNNQISEAILIYEKLLKDFEPNDFPEVRITLFEIFYEINDMEKAIKYIRLNSYSNLTNVETEKVFDLIHKYYIEFQMEQQHQIFYGQIIVYFAEMILSKYFVSTEIDVEKLKNTTKKSLANFCADDDFQILKLVLNVCLKCEWYDKMHYFTYLTINSKRFRDHREQLALYAIQACALNKDFIGSYTLIREFLIFPYKNTKAFVWNMLNYVSYFIDQPRRQKFSSRFIRKVLENDHNSPLRLFLAGSLLSSGFYKLSLSEFLKCLPYYNDNDDLMECQLINLSISICFLQTSSILSQDDERNTFVVNCISYIFKYYIKRRFIYPAEAYYNLGRCYHQLNNFAYAIDKYNEVLNLSDNNIPDRPNFKFEAAYNLCLIHKQNNRIALANQIMQKYMTI